jgi:transcriptional regulator with XRE-family HTH domain
VRECLVQLQTEAEDIASFTWNLPNINNTKVKIVTATSVPSLIQARQNRLVQLMGQLLQDGWTQTSIAEFVGVEFSTVYRWLKGKTIPEQESRNFQRLAKLSGGNPKTLQQYLDGEITLSAYRQGVENKLLAEINNQSTSTNEKIKQEVIAKIRLLEPSEIAEVISLTAAFLAKQA